MPSCRYCGSSQNLIKAHIIPEAFFRELRDEEQAPLLVTNVAGNFPKKAPIGVYDRDILCLACEEKFLAPDTYGVDVLLTRFGELFKPIRHADRDIALEASAVDSKELLRFLVSVLWRASVSSHDFYAKVALGPHETTARLTVQEADAPIPMVFDAVLSRWSDEESTLVPTTAMLNPMLERWDDVNAYRLYFGRIVAYVKVDRRPFPQPFVDLSLQNASVCRVISRTMAKSKDLRAMKRAVLGAHRNMREFRGKRGAA